MNRYYKLHHNLPNMTEYDIKCLLDQHLIYFFEPRSKKTKSCGTPLIKNV